MMLLAFGCLVMLRRVMLVAERVQQSEDSSI